MRIDVFPSHIIVDGFQFKEELHPRGGKGTHEGGRFVKGHGTAITPKAASETPNKHEEIKAVLKKLIKEKNEKEQIKTSIKEQIKTSIKEHISKSEIEDLQKRVNEKGGFTYQPITKDSPQPGDTAFAVSYSKTTEKVIDKDKLKLTDIVKYIIAHQEDLSKKDHYLGAWVDGDKVYLDCSIVTKDEKEAVKIAQENDQLAYFSFKNLETVTTPQKSKSMDEKQESSISRMMIPGNMDLQHIIELYQNITGKTANKEDIEELQEMLDNNEIYTNTKNEK